MYICDVYESSLKFYCQRFSNNNHPIFTDQELLTDITNIHDSFDFLDFNIRKYGNEILAKPTKKIEKRFMENIRKVIGHKGCKQESLIRHLHSLSYNIRR